MTVNIATNSCVQLKFTQHISSVLNYNRPSVLNHHHLITNSQQLYKAKSFSHLRSILRNYRKLWRTVIPVNWITIPCLPFPLPPPPLQQMIYALFYVQVPTYTQIDTADRIHVMFTHTTKHTPNEHNTKESRLETRKTKEPFIRFHSRLHFLPHVSLDRAILAKQKKQQQQQCNWIKATLLELEVLDYYWSPQWEEETV